MAFERMNQLQDGSIGILLTVLITIACNLSLKFSLMYTF